MYFFFQTLSMKLVHLDPSFRVPYLNNDIIKNYSDLVVKSTDGNTIILNQLVLVCWSKYMKEMFLNNSIDRQNNFVILTNANCDELKLLHDFIMNGALPCAIIEIQNGKLPCDIDNLFQSFGIDLRCIVNSIMIKLEGETELMEYNILNNGLTENHLHNPPIELDEDKIFIDEIDINHMANIHEGKKKRGRPKGSGVIAKIPNDQYLFVDSKFGCLKCSKFFKSESILKQHFLKSGHGKVILENADGVQKSQSSSKRERENVCCELCGKHFKFLSLLNSHINNVHEKDQTCYSCEKTFSKKYFQEHIKIYHKKEREMMCEICSKLFSQRKHLKTHIKVVHKKERDYVCQECGRPFGRADKLKEHVRIVHEGVKDHKCKYCGKKFARHDYLKKHIKSFHEITKKSPPI